MKQPAEEARKAIAETIATGSGKDGSNELWRDEDTLFHLVKAQAHLATHIKFMLDDREKSDENHLHKAITRIAFVMCMPDK